ncbi:MAG: undecaprenyl-diphosphatase UppP [Patescibacteria group bacterium]|nr:undecaprenyl-diphosphatase UppP [Patescibacteria group bacterium]
MIDYVIAILFGLIQGVTEFLPVSSSGHLLLTHKFLSLPIDNELAFDVVLHFATFLAVFLYFLKDIIKILKSWLKSFSGKIDESACVGWQIILATIPAATAGYFLEDIIENKLRSVFVVVIMLFIVALLFVIFEKIKNKQKEISDISWKKALIIGFAQSLALIPGTSRSGITIIAGLGVGLKREAAVRFSFLLSLPIILGASIKKIPQLFNAGLDNYEFLILLAAFCASFISGWLTIKYFLRFVKKHSLISFALYRIILAIIVLLLFL